MMKKWLVVVAIAGLMASCLGQSKNRPHPLPLGSATLAALDSLFQAAVQAREIPGGVALVAVDGEIAYRRAFGYSELEASKSQQPSDLFRIASMTKPVTAVAAMMLYEEGKFALDDPLSKFIPAFAHPQILEQVNLHDSTFTAHPAKNEITVRQLFTHSSGIGYGFQDEKLMALYEKAGISEGFEERDILLAHNVLQIARMPLLHEPGRRFTYGLNSDVLGRLVEIWSGMPLDEFFQKKIFAPLGMEDTFFYLPEGKQDRLTEVYMSSPRGAVKTDYPLIHYPVRGARRYFSGGADLSSTIDDYYLFCRMLYNLGELNGIRILQPETVKLMTSSHLEMGDEDMGLGLTVLSEKTTYNNPRSIGSYGGGGFFTTTFWIDPQEKIIALLFLQMYPFDHWEIQTEFEKIIYRSP